MKAIDPQGNWTEKGCWMAWNKGTKTRADKHGFATAASCWNWIHRNFSEDANGVTECVTAEWLPTEIDVCGE